MPENSFSEMFDSSRLRQFIGQHDYSCWCGASEATVYCRQMFWRRFAVLKCRRCGTQRILPRALLSAASAASLYNEDQHTRSTLAPDVIQRNADRILHRIQQTGISFQPGSTVLDIGCSEGSLLETIRQRFGAQVIGVDVDERTIERARKNYPKVTFHRGLVQDLFDRLPKADVVIASAIVEHVIDPEAFLAQLRAVMKPDGKLFLLTPNASSINYSLLRSWWRELLSIGEHIYLFTPESLAAAAERAGLKVHGLATGYDELPSLRFAFPKRLKAAAIIPWACYRATVKALCLTLPHGRRGDILYASFEPKTSAGR